MTEQSSPSSVQFKKLDRFLDIINPNVFYILLVVLNLFIYGMSGINYLRPSEIRFTQDSIAGRFQDGRHINTAINDIQNGSLRPEEFPSVRVIYKNESLYSLDNRRLYVFRVAEYNGWISKIPIRMEPSWKLDSEKFTTNNQGLTIYVRQGGIRKHYKKSWFSKQAPREIKSIPAALPIDDTYEQRTNVPKRLSSLPVSPIAIRPDPKPATITRNLDVVLEDEGVYKRPSTSNPRQHHSTSRNTQPRVKSGSNPAMLPINDTYNQTERVPNWLNTYSVPPTITRQNHRPAAINRNTNIILDDEDIYRRSSTSNQQPRPEPPNQAQPRVKSTSKRNKSFSTFTEDEPNPTPPVRVPAHVVQRKKTGLFRRFLKFCCCCCSQSE